MSGAGFPVNEAEGSKIQAMLQNIVEELLRKEQQQDQQEQHHHHYHEERLAENDIEALDEELKNKEEKSFEVEGLDLDKEDSSFKPEIEVWQNDNMVYGKNSSDQQINKIDVRTEAKLELATDLPVGTKVSGLENTAIVFRSEANKTQEIFKVNQDGVIDLNKINQSQNQNQSNDISNQESSSARLKDVFAKQKQTPQIQALSQHVAQLQEQIKQQQEFIDQQLKYNKNQQNFNAELLRRVNENKKVQQARMNSRDPDWWQKGINKFKELKEIYQQRRQEQKVAKTLNQLWDKNTNKGAKVYQGSNYNMERYDSNFILKDKDNKVLFEYGRSSFGNTVFDNQLSPKDLEQINILNDRLKNKVVQGQFESIDTKQKYLSESSQKIASDFVDIARQQKDGKFVKQGENYNISAKASGEVNIYSNGENPQLIYSQNKNGQYNAMSEKDIGVLSKGLDQFKENQQNLLNKAQEKINQSNIGQSLQEIKQSVGKTLTRGGR